MLTFISDHICPKDFGLGNGCCIASKHELWSCLTWNVNNFFPSVSNLTWKEFAKELTVTDRVLVTLKEWILLIK